MHHMIPFSQGCLIDREFVPTGYLYGNIAVFMDVGPVSKLL